jgi:hypothetical protein
MMNRPPLLTFRWHPYAVNGAEIDTEPPVGMFRTSSCLRLVFRVSVTNVHACFYFLSDAGWCLTITSCFDCFQVCWFHLFCPLMFKSAFRTDSASFHAMDRRSMSSSADIIKFAQFRCSIFWGEVVLWCNVRYWTTKSVFSLVISAAVACIGYIWWAGLDT